MHTCEDHFNNRRLENCCLSVGSQFWVKNMETWIHPVLYQKQGASGGGAIMVWGIFS